MLKHRHSTKVMVVVSSLSLYPPAKSRIVIPHVRRIRLTLQLFIYSQNKLTIRSFWFSDVDYTSYSEIHSRRSDCQCINPIQTEQNWNPVVTDQLISRPIPCGKYSSQRVLILTWEDHGSRSGRSCLISKLRLLSHQRSTRETLTANNFMTL